MKHNRPFYGKEVTVIIQDINKSFLIHKFPRWLEQTYQQRSFLIIGPPNLYFDTKRICKRYGIETTFGEEYQNSKCHFMPSLPSLDRIETEVISTANADCFPVAYYLDIAMMAIDYERDVICSEFKTKSKSNPSQSIILHPSLLGLTDGSEKKCCVYIPVMNREKNISESFEGWISQTYSNTQIVIIDYSSTVPLTNLLVDLTDKYKKTLSADPNSDADVILIRVEDQNFFNISHAYNYAVQRTKSDVLCFVCADSVPWDFYIELCMNLVNDNNLLQLHWGIHTITRSNWEKLNGHQEFIVGWGAEDDDFRIRAEISGLTTLHLPSQIVFQIPQNAQDKGKNRMIKDISESAMTNMARFQQYNAKFGCVANYGEEIGRETPIKYRPIESVEKPLRLYCFEEKYVGQVKLTEDIKYHKEFKMYYILTRSELVEKLSIPHYHFFVYSEMDIDKYLNTIR